MALSTAVISFDIADLVGDDFDPRHTKVIVTTNIPGGVIADTGGNQIRVGDGRGTIADDGTGTVTVWTPGAGSNPASWQTYIQFDYAPRRPGAARLPIMFGPFTVSGNANLADLIAEQAIPPTYLSEVSGALQAFVDQAAASAAAAAAAVVTPGSNQWIKDIGGNFNFAFTGSLTIDGPTGLPTAGAIKWPDGRTGAFVGTTDADYYTGYTATYVPQTGPTKTLTASGITFDTASGLPLGPTGLAVA